MATVLKITQGSTAPIYDLTLKRDDGSVIDLTNTTPTMKLCRGTTQTNIGHEALTIVSAGAGIAGWKPGTGDLPTPGTYKGDIKVTYADTSYEILYGQLTVKVRKAL